MITCPDCKHKIEIEADEIEVGDIVVCENCGLELLVTKKKPLKFERIDEEK